MRLVVLLALLAAAAMLGFAACGGSGSGSTTAASDDPDPGSTTITIEGMSTEPEEPGATTATEPTLAGDATAGKQVFLSTGCGSCHTLRAAGATGTIGPDLDQRLVIDSSEADTDLTLHVREAIEDPDAVVSPGGYQAGTMPGNYAEQLSDQQRADLVAFVVDAVQ